MILPGDKEEALVERVGMVSSAGRSVGLEESLGWPSGDAM